jgi:hypothetical protein
MRYKHELRRSGYEHDKVLKIVSPRHIHIKLNAKQSAQMSKLAYSHKSSKTTDTSRKGVIIRQLRTSCKHSD